MADIFISYSKAERGVTEALARNLETAGYTVWWDTGLVSGDVFKDVILAELVAAKAAIVIWTKGSIHSQWVYAEATRAQAMKKLLPLRTPDVGPDDLPMPFGTIHTDLVDNLEAVKVGLGRLGVMPVAAAASAGAPPVPPKAAAASPARPGQGVPRLAALSSAAALVVVLAGLGLWHWLGAAAPSQGPQANNGPAPITDCDRLAASPVDPLAVAKGVPTEQLTPQAFGACQAAVATYPKEVRLWEQLGRAALKMQDASTARTWLQKAADAGSSEGMALLGAVYQFGLGTAADPAQARAWYERSAALGNADGLANLAFLYANGTGVTTDYAKAHDLYEKAAAAGSSPAMYFLGYMAFNGYGVAKDTGQALSWYQKAADAGNSAAMYTLALMYGSGSGVARDAEKAAQLFEKAAKAGNPLAMAALAGAYESGTGVPKDLGKAKTWYEAAANGGVATAMMRVGDFYENGIAVPKDFAAARGWYEKAAAAGEMDGAVALALMLDDGSGGSQDFARAAILELQAAKRGNAEALTYLRARAGEWSLETRTALQQELARRGFYKGPTDGAWTEEVKAAVEAFLKAGG